MRGVERVAAEHGDARVARVVDADALLEVEIPLPVFRLLAPRDVHRGVRVVHRQRARQLARNVVPAGARGAAIRLLQRDDVGRGHEAAAREGCGRRGDVALDHRRARAVVGQPGLAQQAARDQEPPDRVTDVEGCNDQPPCVMFWRAGRREAAELDRRFGLLNSGRVKYFRRSQSVAI